MKLHDSLRQMHDKPYSTSCRRGQYASQTAGFVWSQSPDQPVGPAGRSEASNVTGSVNIQHPD